ncbi:ABC transporter permease [Patescibacteria group bacterium]|nr:ABC transporter permease [Patescibacteria group bacterium]MBU1682750.1 ABC transporter permease [Patescibacteria group bacterium]
MKKILQTSFALAKAGFKLKNEGNYLGLLWYVIDPLMLFMIFVLVRGVLGKGIEYYPIYLFLGLIIFNFFRKATGSAINSMSSNSGLITNMQIRQETFILSSYFQSAFAHIFEVLIVVVLLIVFKLPLWYLLFYVFIFFVFSLFVLGISFIISTIAVYVKDLLNIWGTFTRFLWFATPIFYSARLELPFDFNKYNPMYHFIKMSRDVIIYHQMPEYWMMIASVTISVLMFFIGFFIFNKAKPYFAEKL